MEPVIVPRSEHTISRKLIDPDAVKVLYRLHRAGYQAYLVGGGVRDLLVDRRPKDFDISTDAHPHQVKRLFRNCRLIGRRFRLAHVHFGDKIVEVSTFRRRSDPVEGETEEDILIRSDNTFGNAEEDALRRDFTINGLFYDIGTFSLIDYVGGLDDLKDRVIRTIGNPDIRFREDPVRMIRAVKFAARLGFTIEPQTFEAILRHRDELAKSAQPRLLEEVYRLLGGGAAEVSFRLLHRTGLLDMLMPALAAHIESSDGSGAESNPFWRWLARLDQLRAEGTALSNPVLLGILLGEMAFLDADDDEDEPARLSYETEDRLRGVLGALGVPRRDTERLFQIYRAQRRLIGGKGRRFSPRAFVTKNYFGEAFRFFSVYVDATGRHREEFEKWQGVAGAPSEVAGAMPERRRRRRRRRRGGPRDIDGIERGPDAGFDWNESDAEPPPETEVLETPGKERVAAPPKPVRSDDDEDSQIRFLGWSDQPEILRPRSAATPAPPAAPYARPGGQGRGAWRGGAGKPAGGDSRRPAGGRPGFGPRQGTAGGPPAADGASARRDGGRRGGRRRPKGRQD
jgi:poly(A) polymerase